MVTPLTDVTRGDSGNKAGALAQLLKAGFPVPDGFVVPAHDLASNSPEINCEVRGRIEEELSRLGDPLVAVRSSAADEDSVGASAAGMYESVLGAHGPDDVIEAIAVCRSSAASSQVTDYRRRHGRPEGQTGGMTVLVQILINADVSGVMFTPTGPGQETRIESSWGLGLSVVGGGVTPDVFEVGPDGRVRARVAAKSLRSDSVEGFGGVGTTAVPHEEQTTRSLNDADAAELAALGARVAAFLGGPQDIEWAMADGEVWIVQARPVTAPVPALPGWNNSPGPHGGKGAGLSTFARRTAAESDHAGAHADEQPETLFGTPGASGITTARARIVSGPSAFADVRPGELVVCPFTDPAWTPLLSIAAGVVTEVGGALSHAAIVAREYGVPVVLGVPEARERITDGDFVTIDGTRGTVTMH